VIAVGFDFDHTLGVDRGLEKEAFVRLAADFGVTLALEEHGGHHRLVDELLDRFRADKITLDAAADAFVTAIAEIEAGLEGQPPGLRYRRICYALVDELVAPIDGAAELIHALANADIPTAILTNGWSPLQQLKIARALGEFPGSILVSDQIGTLKPAEGAFARLATALGVARGDIWYVGDNPAVDVAGAHAAGMRAVWFDWEGHAYPPDIAPPDVHLKRLAELFPLLQPK
jgi:FMN phosphatase YigB (HAD superfamily)